MERRGGVIEWRCSVPLGLPGRQRRRRRRSSTTSARTGLEPLRDGPPGGERAQRPSSRGMGEGGSDWYAKDPLVTQAPDGRQRERRGGRRRGAYVDAVLELAPHAADRLLGRCAPRGRCPRHRWRSAGAGGYTYGDTWPHRQQGRPGGPRRRGDVPQTCRTSRAVGSGGRHRAVAHAGEALPDREARRRARRCPASAARAR